MHSSNSTLEKVSFSDQVEAVESDIPVSEQTVSMGTMVDDPDGLLAAAAEEQSDDLERRLRPRTDSRGTERRYESPEYDWERDATPDIESDREVEFDLEKREFVEVEDNGFCEEAPPSPDRREGETLAAQEKRTGEEAEMERYREAARDAQEAGLERATSNREAVSTHAEAWFDDAPKREPCDVAVFPNEWKAENDLVETLDDDVASTVKEQAARIADDVDGGPEEGLIRRLLAERIRRGQDPIAAVDDLLRKSQRWPGAEQDFETVRWADKTATVEGEVITLWDPNEKSQRQVGVLQDDNGDTRRFVIWKRSGKTVRLHEGARVRLENAEVDVYQGEVNFPVTSNTTVRVLEEGDGPGPFRGYGASSSKAGEDAEHAWANGMPERHIEKFGPSASTKRR